MLRRTKTPLTTLTAMLLFAAPDATAQRLEFPDGEWVAQVTAASVGRLRTAGAIAQFDGTMEFVTLRGVVTGIWNLTGDGQVEVPGGSGVTHYVMEGDLAGTAERPMMASRGGRMDIVMTIQGIPLEQSTDLGAGTALPLELVSVTCKEVTGRWQIGYADMMSGQGWFIATKVNEDLGPDFTPYGIELRRLLWRAVEFAVATVKEKAVDMPTLEGLLEAAERLTRNTRRNEGCGVEDVADFDPAIAAMIADLVTLAYDNAELFDVGQLVRLARAASELGVLGPDAAKPAAAVEVTDQLSATLEKKMEDMEEEDKCRALGSIVGGAVLIGNVSLAERAQARRESLGC